MHAKFIWLYLGWEVMKKLFVELWLPDSALRSPQEHIEAISRGNGNQAGNAAFSEFSDEQSPAFWIQFGEAKAICSRMNLIFFLKMLPRITSR
jgi:hypothetical protein